MLAVSGSLRGTSSNTAVLTAAAALAPPGIEITMYGDLAAIPPFNPDLDTETPPAAVATFRAALQGCDALLICSPEYAHGVSGVMKNALDWLVGSGELIDKPIALINASPRATIAHGALRETLVTMTGRVIDDASITLPLDGGGWTARRIVEDDRLSAMLVRAVTALAEAARR